MKGCVCFVLFVKGFPSRMKRVVLRVNGRGVRFEPEQMRLEFFEVRPVTHRAELRTMEFLELPDQFGMR
jgi:hypothetical protein